MTENLPGLMEVYPGLMPWHFGGEERLTWRECRVLRDRYEEKIEEAKRQEKEQRKRSR